MKFRCVRLEVFYIKGRIWFGHGDLWIIFDINFVKTVTLNWDTIEDIVFLTLIILVFIRYCKPRIKSNPGFLLHYPVGRLQVKNLFSFILSIISFIFDSIRAQMLVSEFFIFSKVQFINSILFFRSRL
jgi:hypothetical protein